MPLCGGSLGMVVGSRKRELLCRVRALEAQRSRLRRVQELRRWSGRRDHRADIAYVWVVVPNMYLPLSRLLEPTLAAFPVVEVVGGVPVLALGPPGRSQSL